ncbi:TetR/AcrR family transcriptional regulator [Streptomyces candidus]|uniref:AcrR family transcriptional regulator n=1 Tax=Streptomyces candidus TaxID=67283 RepID=A0A7X0LPF2_9ACTN|nr:TetR/AcrR family transcriptional regulator [Streptomyces candidus]MBB6434851.1 AcrR family transcriptional regulator [Streptomyces candidus]GHH41653.1 TetR family transcriptional regulator [Streptomyces candidus]
MSATPNPQRRSEKSRQAILAASIDLCSEKGYGGVTMEAIAARAGVSKKTIYRWWPSKGAVLLEAVGQKVDSEAPFPDTGDLAGDLYTQMNRVVRLLTTPPFGPAYIGILSELHHDAELTRAVHDQFITPRFTAAVNRLKSAQRQGRLAADADLEMTVELLYGPLYYRYALRKPPHSPERTVKLVDHVLRSLDCRP